MNTDLEDIYRLLKGSRRELLYKIDLTHEKLERLNENLARIEERMREFENDTKKGDEGNESDADSQGRDGQGA